MLVCTYVCIYVCKCMRVCMYMFFVYKSTLKAHEQREKQTTERQLRPNLLHTYANARMRLCLCMCGVSHLTTKCTEPIS